jgi:hypothetical protein
MPASKLLPKLLKINVLGLVFLFLLVDGVLAKDSKPLVPPYVLNAHTVAVVVDPDAGVSLTDPDANQVAQRDVEAAILKWGRFTTVLGSRQADLVIVLRKGHGKLVDETIPDPRQNSRPGSISSADNGINIGAQHGSQPGLQNGSAADGDQIGTRGGHPQTEIGGVYDSFVVYEGNVERPLDGAAGWRWVRKDGLRSHDVPAVDEFRKAITEAEKQAAKQAAKHP